MEENLTKSAYLSSLKEAFFKLIDKEALENKREIRKNKDKTLSKIKILFDNLEQIKYNNIKNKTNWLLLLKHKLI